jgi:hypothetical protein
MAEKQEREEKEARERAAILIQSYARRWICCTSHKGVVKGMLVAEV